MALAVWNCFYVPFALAFLTARDSAAGHHRPIYVILGCEAISPYLKPGTFGEEPKSLYSILAERVESSEGQLD